MDKIGQNVQKWFKLDKIGQNGQIGTNREKCNMGQLTPPKSFGSSNVIFFPSGLYTTRTHFFDAVVLKSKSAMSAFIRADPSAGAMQASLSVDANAARAASASASKSKSKRKLNLEIDPLLEMFNNNMFKVHFF